MRILLTVAGAFSLMLAGSAQAQFFGHDTSVDGNVTVNVNDDSSIVTVVGAHSSATSLKSSVTEGSRVRGNFVSNNTSDGDVVAVVGSGAIARNVQASVDGASVNGNVTLNAHTGQVVTVAVGAGAVACTSVASVHRSTPGGYRASASTGDIVNIGIGTIWPGVVVIGSRGRPC